MNGGGGGGGCPFQLFYITSTTFLTLIWLPAQCPPHSSSPFIFLFSTNLSFNPHTPHLLFFLSHTAPPLSLTINPSISCKSQNPFKCKREKKKNTFLAKPTTQKTRTCLNSLSSTPLLHPTKSDLQGFIVSLLNTNLPFVPSQKKKRKQRERAVIMRRSEL